MKKIPSPHSAFWLAASAATALLLSACGQSNTSTPASTPSTPAATASSPAVDPAKADLSSLKGKTIHIAFIPKGMQNSYWLSVKKGIDVATKEATDAGIKLTVDWNGPPSENDRPAEIQLMETYIAQKLDGIILCPMEFNALVAPTDKARHAGIPVVIVDSALNYSDIVSFVGTDNHNAGILAGKELAQEMGDKGNVIVMRFKTGSASTNDREEGLLDELKKNHPNIKVLSSDNYSGDDANKAIGVASDLLTSFKGQVDGVFTPNQPSTVAMLTALENAQLAGKVKFVGFDADEKLMNGLKNGELGALVLQYPYEMGYLGVKAMLANLAGQNVVPNVNTGATILRKDNQNDPAVKALLDNTVQ
ncbi:MAG TPA: substrate-binding domain-containing protein [Opitutales bacterium]|jgi:ribose transport system substrate-binding protein|nr:substrate-binding domain-containing protein [Opitutales bacterium]